MKQNISFIIFSIIILSSCRNEDSINSKDFPQITASRIDTINATYIMWACACANWVDKDFIAQNSYLPPDKLVSECFYIEAEKETDKLPKKYYSNYNNVEITLIGSFYLEKGISRDYESPTNQKPEHSGVFKYSKFVVNEIDSADLKIINIKNTSKDSLNIEKVDMDYAQKASIEKDSIIWLFENIKLDYQIFGYKTPDSNSEKLIVLSVFTNDVKDNPFNCKYGAYYGTSSMGDIQLKYVGSKNEFYKMDILKSAIKIDEIYMEKRWFEFEK